MLTVRALDFAPSIDGFRFSCLDLPSPHIVLTLPNGTTLGLDEVTTNLGGGMMFVAADYIRDGGGITTSSTAPVTDSTLYAYIVARQVDSLDMATINTILSLMSPDTPDHDDWQYNTSGDFSRTRALLDTQLPAVKRDVDQNRLAQVTLIDGVMRNARSLGVGHRQVIVYAYDVLDDASTLLHVYDAAYPQDDGVTLLVPLVPYTDTLSLTYSRDVPVAGFFRSPFAAKMPMV